jgi:cytochrome c-type biogenesis protein CcmH/NrfG
VIQPLGADGSIPLEDASGRRWSDGALLAFIVGALLLVAAAVGGLLLWNGHNSARSSSAQSIAGSPPTTTRDGRDLSQVTNEEMEAVVTANPDVVPMRLALVERYLGAADGEQTAAARTTQLERARSHAGEAAARATNTADQARALRYLGWTTALLTDPARGAALLEQSLAKEPGNPDALWFLATVRFDRLHDPAAAKPLLEQLLTSGVDAAQRQAVQTKLDNVNAALSGASSASR